MFADVKTACDNEGIKEIKESMNMKERIIRQGKNYDPRIYCRFT